MTFFFGLQPKVGRGPPILNFPRASGVLRPTLDLKAMKYKIISIFLQVCAQSCYCSILSKVFSYMHYAFVYDTIKNITRLAAIRHNLK